MFSNPALTIGLCVVFLVSLAFYSKVFIDYAKGLRKTALDAYDKTDACVAGIVVVFLLLLMAGGSSKTPEKLTLDTIIIGTLLYAGVGILLLGVLISRNNNPITLFGLKKFHPILALGWLVAAVPLVYCVQEVSIHYLFSKNSNPQPVISFITAHSDLKTLIVLGVNIVVIAPLVEEVIFRGFLYGVISRYFGRWAGLFVSALLFAGVHNHLPIFIPLFLLAVCLTLAYERSGSLWTSILMHAGFNTFSFSMILLFPEMAK